MQNIKVILSIPSALLLVVAVVEGYSSGAPKSRCDSMHPDHGHGLLAQPNSTNTFIISTGELVNRTMDIVVSYTYSAYKLYFNLKHHYKLQPHLVCTFSFWLTNWLTSKIR